MEVARSNHSNASCFSDKPCNSPRFIKQNSGDEQSLDSRFSGSTRILCLGLIHKCEGWGPFQLRQCKSCKASQTLDFLKPIAMLLKTAKTEKQMWSSRVNQLSLNGSQEWCYNLVPGTRGDAVAGSEYLCVLCSAAGEVKEQLPGKLLDQDFPCFSLCLRFEDESQEDET